MRVASPPYQHVLAHRRDVLAGDDPGTDGSLDGHLEDSGASFGADQKRVVCVKRQGVFNLCLGVLDLGAGEIDLVNDRNDGQLIGHGQLGVGEDPGSYAL